MNTYINVSKLKHHYKSKRSLKITSLELLSGQEILYSLKNSLSQANKSIFIVGPWLDAYFTRMVVNFIKNREISVKFVVRIEQGSIDTKTLSALNLAHQNLINFQARSMENLHSKVIFIDEKIFFLGSANWYWYSLNKGVEVTIKGSSRYLPQLKEELDLYWKNSSPIPEDQFKDCEDFKPVKYLIKK